MHVYFIIFAIAYQIIESSQLAEAAYKRAIELEEGNDDFCYGLITLYMQQEQYEKALNQAEELNQKFPNNPQINQLIRMIDGNYN